MGLVGAQQREVGLVFDVEVAVLGARHREVRPVSEVKVFERSGALRLELQGVPGAQQREVGLVREVEVRGGVLRPGL